MNIVLDASALLRFTAREAGYVRMRELLRASRDGQLSLSMSAVNWSEVAYKLIKGFGSTPAQPQIAAVRRLNFQVFDATEQTALDASLIRFEYKLPFADSFAAALTKQLGATLVTADYDFQDIAVAGAISVEFLSAK